MTLLRPNVKRHTFKIISTEAIISEEEPYVELEQFDRD